MQSTKRSEYQTEYWKANKDRIYAKRQELKESRGHKKRVPTPLEERDNVKKEKAKRWYLENRERILQQAKNSKEARREWSRIAHKNPMTCLKRRVRSRLAAAFKSRSISKRTGTRDIIGCDWPLLKAHIENQFTKGMNWKNKEKWHIDHIIPMATATTEQEVLRLSHFTNLRPLWATDNATKGVKIITCQPELMLLH